VVAALEWLCDFTSVVGREEAAEMAAQFVRFGLITLVSDKRKSNDSAIIFTVRGSASGGNWAPISVSTHHLMHLPKPARGVLWAEKAVLLMYHCVFFAFVASWRVLVHSQGHLQDHGRGKETRALGWLTQSGSTRFA
jgi:hypothetical protein